jgi:hypothetical protein
MNTAKVIKPIVITDAMLTSSTVAENDYPAWASGTTFATGGKCISTVTHRIYESLKDANVGKDPTDIANRTGDSPWWLDIGPTNKLAMFDNVVGTVTTGTSPVTVVLRPGSVSGLAMLELSGRQAQVTMKDAPGGTVVYDRTVDLDGTIIESVFDWFFAEFEQHADFVLTDLPAQFSNCELAVSVSATTGSAGVGVLKVGTVVELGRTLAGAKAGIMDFSGKERDTFGNTLIVERAYSKEASFDIVTDSTRFNKIFRTLASIRATPAVYIGTESAGYEPLIVYGFFKDFSITVEYFSHHLCSLEIEGLV